MRWYLSVMTMGVFLMTIAAPYTWAMAISITNSQALTFGSFVAGSGGAVTVSTNGTRSASGGVLLVPSSEGTPAQFTVSGDANATYSIQLPQDNFVKLTGPGADMVISDFISDPSGVSGQLSVAGSQALLVGGTLNVASEQQPGIYSGSFTVMVDYN